MHVLVVEDEAKTAAFIRQGLQENGFAVTVAGDGAEGARLAVDVAYDLIVADVMLPGMDGWSMVRRIRDDGRATPIIFLTARDDVTDRIRGLESGADDYLVKPFFFSELLARIRAVLRRGPQRQSDVLCIADLEVDPVRRHVRRGGTPVELTPKEFALLWLLASRSGEVLSRTIIIEHVWDVNSDSDGNVVDVAVRRLRRKVDAPFGRALIHTVRGVGYVLDPERTAGGD